MRTASCPSCGAPLRFRGATSVVAVCTFCRATLVRKGADLENIGKQAELLEDDSPLRIGTDGKHRNKNFSIVGRIQYRYGAGLWNEWHVLFSDGKSAWLSDASRNYTIAYLAPPAEVPLFEKLQADMQLKLAGDTYTVTNIEEAEVVAGEGELPFKFEAGWKANVADLRGPGARFATIDYSEDRPLIYIGERLPFDTFSFSGLRDPNQIGFTQGSAQAFKCKGCGAPIEKHLTTTEVVACSSCGSITDVTGTEGTLVQKNERNEQAARASIPVGTTGKWQNVNYEIVGFMRRGVTVEGEFYEWSEYLLHNTAQGYAWISEYDGHFSFIRDAAEIPKKVTGLNISGRQADVRYLGRKFRHFQRAEAKVTHVVGEFYWRVKVGDQVQTDDYVDPPLILSSEKTSKEVSWSLGEYVEPAALWKAFQVSTPLPTRKGVAPNQPSPHAGKVMPYWVIFMVALIFGLVVNLGVIAVQSGKRVTPLTFTVPTSGSERAVSPVFDITGGGSRPVTVHTHSGIAGTWLALDMSLVNADTGRAYRLQRELGFRQINTTQVGSTQDMAEIPDVPAGRYTLALDAKAGPMQAGSVSDIQGRVEIYREEPGWTNFLLLMGFLILFPLVAWGRKAAFETRRWAESDYAPD